jgi:hypothetical protein
LKAQAAVVSVMAERPHWRKQFADDIGQGPRGTTASSRTFADVLREGAGGSR